MGNYPNITYKQGCNPCSKGEEYPKISYRPSLLREQVPPITPEVGGQARREQIHKELRHQADIIKQELSKEIHSYQPIGKMSEIGEVLGIKPTRGQLVSTPFGSYVFAKARLPDAETIRRWHERYGEARELETHAGSEYQFMVVGPGLTTGNIRTLEQGRRLKAQGLLSPRELKYVDALEEFWAKYPDADYGVVQPDGSIKLSTRFKPVPPVPKAESNPATYPSVSYNPSYLKVKPIARVVTVPGGSQWRCDKCGKLLSSGSQAVKMGSQIFCVECVRGARPSLLVEAGETLKISPLKENVWLVNGQYIRDKLDVDFVLGGHDLRYPFIPTGEIWIDEAAKPEERECLVAHEVEERRLMAEGIEYGKAHEAANVIEAECRNIELLASTEGNPIRKFCCRQCSECAPKKLLEEGRFAERIAWLKHHYKEKHPSMWGKKYPEISYSTLKEKDWLDKIAEREPYCVHVELYPKIREKFDIPKYPSSRNQLEKALNWLVGELKTRGITASAPPYPSVYVEIPIKYYRANKDKILDALDEITGVKHIRPEGSTYPEVKYKPSHLKEAEIISSSSATYSHPALASYNHI